MTPDQLRNLQKPHKDRYREDPATAVRTLSAIGELGMADVTCRIDSPNVKVAAGLHPATGGSGEHACSGDMLLESLVSCAGVTLAAVATAMNIPINGGKVKAEGDLDFRGTLGVSKEVPVGLTNINLTFELDTTADEEQIATLIKLTERYCVVFQTLRQPPNINLSIET